ncbi:unnamed protein product [Tuber aestivum]|uniref:FAS1 domain-containing protein n=1 Tax=Tuber aestivum TaxID=59557 RepID=A0A292PX66_9PEZI|nr:unnamed protein product [Tuber aestivum]
MLIFILLPLSTHICRAQADPNRPSITHLHARQDTANTTAFLSTSTAQAGSCTSQGWALCGTVCIDAANGETCCDNSNSHWCMPGTYCFLDSLCCPNGVDPKTCLDASGPGPPTSSTGLSGTTPLNKTSPEGPSSDSDAGRKSGAPSPSTRDGSESATAPVTTTYGPITATVAGNPVTLAFSGEVLPLQTVANRKPVSRKFKEAVLAALDKDPATKAFGDLLTQAPSAFEGLGEKKEYYLFVPTSQFVVDYLTRSKENPPRLAHREVFVDPNMSQQFAEKPKGGPNIKRESITLKTTLVGETKYSDLGEGEGARVVSNPIVNKNGSIQIVSGLGRLTLVHPEEIPFEDGVIMKCDGFFTLPLPIEATFANTSGHLWSTAMEKANILKQVSEKRMVTIFAVQDSALDEADLPGSAELSRHIHDGLSYTPDMRDQPCLPTRDGGSVRITTEGNDRFVNGVRISTSNVIARNGVIHYVEKKIPPASKCPDSKGGGPRKSASSTATYSMVAVLGLSAATLAVYLWV